MVFKSDGAHCFNLLRAKFQLKTLSGIWLLEVPVHWPHFVTSGFVEWKSTLQPRSQGLSSQGRKTLFLPLLPLGWGDERPWERGWLTLLIGPVIVLNHAMRRHIHFVKQKKTFRQNRPHSPRNMLFTLMLAVSADFVTHKGKLA